MFTACVSGSGPSYKAAEVIERIDGESTTPPWASGKVTMFESDGKVFFVSANSMSGDSRVESCTRVAADTGRTEILRYIKDNLTASGQISENSGTQDPAVESLIAFLSSGKLSGVTVQEKYWEKRVESDASGARVLRLKCAAKVMIAKSELTRQLAEATGKSGNAEIRTKLIEAQKSFIEGIDKQ